MSGSKDERLSLFPKSSPVINMHKRTLSNTVMYSRWMIIVVQTSYFASVPLF